MDKERYQAPTPSTAASPAAAPVEATKNANVNPGDKAPATKTAIPLVGSKPAADAKAPAADPKAANAKAPAAAPNLSTTPPKDGIAFTSGSSVVKGKHAKLFKILAIVVAVLVVAGAAVAIVFALKNTSTQSQLEPSIGVNPSTSTGDNSNASFASGTGDKYRDAVSDMDNSAAQEYFETQISEASDDATKSLIQLSYAKELFSRTEYQASLDILLTIDESKLDCGHKSSYYYTLSEDYRCLGIYDDNAQYTELAQNYRNKWDAQSDQCYNGEE